MISLNIGKGIFDLHLSGKVYALRFVFCLALFFPAMQGFSQVTEQFTTPGTYTITVPTGVSTMTVRVWGAGGGGADRSPNNNDGGGGGGAGGFRGGDITVSAGNSITIIVGTGGNSPANSAGGNGGASSFTYAPTGSIITGNGGTGGARTNGGGAGGAAGTGSFAGTVLNQIAGFTSGAGGPGDTAEGGGGGGSAGSTGNGGNGVNVTAGAAGAGGGAAGGAGGNDGGGANGNAPGAGGGGAGDDADNSGGDGGDGQVIVTYNLPATPRTYYSRQTGNWDATTTWSLTGHAGGVATGVPLPAATDVVLIGANHTVTIPAGYSASAATLTVNDDGAGGILSIGTDTDTPATLTVTGDITVAAGGTLQTGGNGGTTRTITLGGNISNGGTVNLANSASPSTVVFNGSANRTISGSGTFAAQNLTLNTTGSSNVTFDMTANLSISGTLTFSANGLLVVGSNANVVLGTAATISGFNSSRYIQLDGATGANSALIKTTTNAVAPWQMTFPIGTSAVTGGYTPLVIPTITTAPANNSTLSVKAIYSASTPGLLRRTFRLTVAGNGNATTFSNGVFAYNNTTDISAGDLEASYTAVWRLTSGASTNIAAIAPPVNQFTVVGGTTATALLSTGTFEYTIGENPTIWYSYQTGNYNDPDVWTLDPSGTTLDNPFTTTPGINDEITILNGFTVTVNVSNQTLSSTTIESGGTLDMSTTTGQILGTVTGAGVLRINGVALPAADYTAFVAATGGTIEYYDTGGNLPASQTTYNKLKMTNSTGANITYLLISNLTVNGTFDISRTGAGTVTWQINDASNTQRTITLNGDITVATGGRIRVGTGNEGSTNPHILNMYGNLTNSGSIKFYDDTDPELAEADYGLTYPAPGIDLHRNEMQGNAVTVTFSGSTNKTVTCSAQTDFYRLVLNKGTGQQNILTINSSNTAFFRLFGPANIATDETGNSWEYISDNALSIINGTLELTGSINIPVLQIDASGTGYFPIPRNGALWLNGANVTVQISDLTPATFGAAKDGRILMSGLLRISAGTLNDGFSKGLGSQDGGTYMQEGGTVNCWQFRPRAVGTGIFSFIQTGGVLNVGYGYALSGGKIDTYEEDYMRFDLNSPNSTFQMSGSAVLNVAKPTNDNGGSGGLFYVGSSSGNYNVTGGTINLYMGEETAGNSYPGYVNTTAPLYNVNIFEESATGENIELQTNGLVVLNNLSINTGNAPAFVTNNLNVNIGGNFTINTGTTYTPGTGTTTFNGAGAQAWTHNGTISALGTVVMNKASGVLTLAGSQVFPNITTALTLTSGTLADGGKTITVSGTGVLSNSATHSGAGVIDYTSTAATITGTGGTFGNLTITTNATIATSGTQSVTGTLRLINANTTLNIGSNALTVLGNIFSDAGTGVAFSNTKRILTSGFHNAGGLTRQGINGPGAAGDILFPVGSAAVGLNAAVLYTPITINVTATTQGTMTVRPVNSEHPNVTVTNQSLKYYWRVTSTGYGGITEVSHKTYNFSTAVQSGTAASYVAARYDRTLNNWSVHNTPQAMTGNIIQPNPFNTATGWTLGPGVVGTQLDGEYTCGSGGFGTVTTYYSRATGNWNVNATWSTDNTLKHTGAAATSNPTACPTCPVVIGDAGSNNHTITTVANSSCGTLTLSSKSTLDCGTFTGHNFGTSTGGAVTGRGTLRIAGITAGTGVFPAGDFTNFLGPTGGTVEWYSIAAPFAIPTTGPTPQSLSLANYYNLHVNAAAGQTITLPATNLTVYNILTKSGAGRVDTNATGARTITINDSLFVSAGPLTLTNGNSTSFVVSGNTIVNGAINLQTGGTRTHTFITSGGIVNNGSIIFLSGGEVVNLTFTGSNNVSFTGTGGTGTTLSLVTVNKGTSQSPTVTFNVGGTVTAATSGWLTLANGTFDFNNIGPHTIVSAAATYAIPSTAKLKVSSGTVNVLSSASNTADLLLNGTLEVAGGTVNIGNAANNNNNDIEYAAAGSPSIVVSGGSLYVNGSIRRSTTTITGALVYDQTGGTVTVGGRNSNNTRGVFEIDANTGSRFTLTGASSLIVQRQTGGTSYADVFINPVTSNVSATSTISVGLGSVATNTNLRINIAPTVGNFTVEGGASAQTVNMFSNPMIVGGNLIITSPSTLVTNSLDVTIAGDLDIQGTGTYTGGTNTTTFNGTGAQAATLTGTSTFNNMTINKTAGTTLTLSGTAPSLNNLNILSGILSVGSNLQVSGDITNNSSQVGAGAIVVFGAASTHNIFSSNGIFTNLTLGGAAASKIVNVTGSMTINGVLNFSTTNRYLMIKSNQLTFGNAASISGANSTAFIRTNGVLGDLGVTKIFPVGASAFTYGIGTLFSYTPVFYSLNTTIEGPLTVIPINSRHLTAISPGEQVLNYYWIVTRGAALTTTVLASHTYTYLASLMGGSGGTLAAGYLDISNPTGWITSGHGGTAVTPVMTFATTPTTNFPAAGNTYHYAVGTSASLPNPLVPVYSRLGAVATVGNPAVGGNWSSINSWTTASNGFGPPVASAPSGQAVVILSGARINTNLNGRKAFLTTNNGLLVTGTTVGHNLGFISGTGTMRVAVNTFPAGNYTSFVSSAGGTIEYVAPMTMNSRTTYNNLSIYSGSAGTVTMTASNLTINGTVTIPVGTTLDNTANNASMSIARNWINNGTFNAGTGAATVTFNGTVAQTTTGATTFNNLTINKTNNLSLGGTTTVNGILTLTAGNIISNTFPTAPLFVLGSAATLSGGSATSFVSGQIRKTMNNASTFIFPIGSNSASRYRPVTISSTSATDTWDISYIPNNPTTDGFDNQLFNSANLGEVSEHEYWQVANGTGTTTAGMTLSFGPGSYGTGGSGDAGIMSSLRTARWNGSQWDTPPGGGTFSFTGNSTAGTVSVSVQSSFSPQTIATLDLNSALPVQLVYFNAQIVGDIVQLNWETSSEVRNNFFTVERSATGEVFTSVGRVDGNGTTNERHTYNLKDFSPLYGTSYYRLKQTDFDGTSTYSRIVSVTYDGPSFPVMHVFPNPTTGNEVTVEIKGIKDAETIPVSIYDQMGREWMKQILVVDPNSGMASGLFAFEKGLPKGMYLIKAGPSQVMIKKFVVLEK